MERESDLAIVRRAYAKQILAVPRVIDPRLQAAFAAVPREDFLGPGPWLAFHMPGFYQPTIDDDPVLLYVNELFGLAAERHINNGQPSLHAALLAAAAIQAGDHVVHIGAGTGYYTAIMAVLAGRVTAVECSSELASRARANLARFADTVARHGNTLARLGNTLERFGNVRVIEGNGAVVPLETADVIYVNAGVTHPVSAWLDALADGGRLIIPLTTDTNTRSFNSISGLFFKIQRRGALFEARALLPTAIIPAEGIREPAAEAALAAAVGKGGWNEVTRLVRGDEALSVPEDQCWVRGDGWCLAT